MDQYLVHIAFPQGTPLKDRIAVIAPQLNDMIDNYEAGAINEGTQVFQRVLIDKIRMAGLLSDAVWLDVGVVGVHPDNREGSGIVPIDVHNLLRRIVQDGWNFTEVECLGCTIPPLGSTEGDRWRDFNERVVQGSNGLLPPISGSFLQAVTARGSHTTGVVRLVKFGAKGVHDDCCLNGRVSQSKIIEKRPSMAEPVNKGLPYTLIKWELVVVCPKLMRTVARTGNIAHGVHRVATALQCCQSVFNAYQQTHDWDKAKFIACQGQTPEFADNFHDFQKFVEAHAGGSDGRYLQGLEQYERSLDVKRLIAASDLQRLASISMPDAPRYVPAMAKALLNAPPGKVVKGYADLFSTNDITSLGPLGKNRKAAAQAGDLMTASSNFLAAYSRLPEEVQNKLVSDLEVRAVMHVHQIKVDTRASYKSLLHIGEVLYREAKELDPNLPIWLKIGAIQAERPSSSRGIRELREDGKVPNSELNDRGIVLHALVHAVGAEATYKVKSLDDEKNVLLESSTQDEDQVEIKVSRVEMLKNWVVRKIEVDEVYIPGQYQSPTDHSEFKSTMWKGLARAALTSVFEASSEGGTKIIRKPEQSVVVTKSFATGKFQLVAMCHPQLVAKGLFKESDTAIDLGKAYDDGDGTMHLVAKQCLAFPKVNNIKDTFFKAVDSFVVAYWAAKSTHDPNAANVIKDKKVVVVKVGTTSYTINVPILVNTKPLHTDDVVLVLKSSTAARDDDEEENPDAKRRKTLNATGKGKGESKGKGASKGKKGKK
jgi:hypothetical protein